MKNKPIQRGIVIPQLLLVIAALGLIIFFIGSNSLPFKNARLTALYPKKESKAATSPTVNTRIGSTIREIQYTPAGRSAKTLKFIVWYPTVAVDTQDAPVQPATGGYPLIVFSHDLNGCGIQSTYITKYLALNGYIVAAPDHEDVSSCHISEAADTADAVDEANLETKLRTANYNIEYTDRPQDINAVINQMITYNQTSGDIFNNSINVNAIGVSGYSLGGWTVAALSGGLPTFANPKVKATLLYAPSIADNIAASLQIKGIMNPIMYLYGTDDKLAGYSDQPYLTSNIPKYYGVIDSANHFTFSDVLKGCKIGCVQKTIIQRYSKAFFDKYLKGDNSADTIVKTKDPEFAAYIFSAP